MDFLINKLLLDQIDTQVWYLIDEQTYGGANKACADFLGLEKEDIENSNLFDILDSKEAKVCIEGNKQVIESRVKIHTEELVNNYKGVKRLLSITKTPVVDSEKNVEYIICSAEDITEKREYETKLKKNDELFREITENMLDMVSLTDKYGYFLYVGPSHETILGYEPQYLIGKNILDFVHPEDIERLRKEYEIFHKTLKPNKIEYRYLHANGFYLWLETFGNVIYDNQGNVKKFIFGSREITEHKSLEQELKNIYHIINNSPVVAFIWKNDMEAGWPVEYVSKNVSDIFGYTVYEFISGNLRYADIIHPDDMERVKSEVSENSSAPDILKFQHEPYRVITKGGDINWVDHRTFIKRDDNNKITQYQGIVFDITERVDFENELQRSRDILDNIIQNTPVGICMTDKYGYFDNVNPAYCDITGYKCGDLLEKHFTTVVPDGYKKELNDLYDSFIDGSDELSGEWPIIDKFGNIKTVLANATKVQDIDGEPKKVTFIIDITERKKTENQLHEYSKELERLNETREIFTDILRHDLLNPVGIVKGYANLLYKNETDEKKIRMLEKVIKNNEKAIELIENAGNLAKIECMDNIEFNLMDISEIIDNSTENLKPAIDEKNIKVKNKNLSGYYSYLNPVIEQAFSNLISNSIKYSPENSDIVVDIIDEKDYWKVCIKDSGPGISDEEKKYIFDRFKQGESKKVSGKGLGLAIVKKIVEIHKGSVGVIDNPDSFNGSMFWIRLKKA